MYQEVVFDIETQKFFDEIAGSDPANLGVSILSLYVRTIDKDYKEIKGEMISFFEDEVSKSWEIFKNADRLIGFNSKHFDVPCLKPYLPVELTKLPHLDILEHVKEINGKRVSLNAIIYWQKRDEESLKKLKFYCEEDVRLTKEIYDYGLKNKKLRFKDYWNDTKTIDVDFSYPKIKSETEQLEEQQCLLF
ncbi:MAG: ribonuclease H-like domain-containing protein [Candidatus Woesebacteria bacterium]|nr:ribonuclease H-like domain-containing protein [Candidatus Woesebacteria bacterium]